MIFFITDIIFNISPLLPLESCITVRATNRGNVIVDAIANYCLMCTFSEDWWTEHVEAIELKRPWLNKLLSKVLVDKEIYDGVRDS
jgi:hypothetical protein